MVWCLVEAGGQSVWGEVVWLAREQRHRDVLSVCPPHRFRQGLCRLRLQDPLDG